MTPEEYEKYVASLYQARGYKTIVTPLSGDWGIDVIATKGTEKIAIQAKMYGHTHRKVNRSNIMELYGAMAFQDCTKAVLATDGELLDDAKIVAEKLNIEILQTRTNNTDTSMKGNLYKEEKTKLFNSYPTFDEAWQKYIMPLKGSTLKNSRGNNKIIDVNWGGIKRITSNDKEGKIDIEGFRLAYNKLIKEDKVTRSYINQQVNKRCSSGIVLILGQLPFVEIVNNPKSLKLKQ